MTDLPPPSIEPPGPFQCECPGFLASACAGEPFYDEHEGKRYCVLHFPSKGKSRAFGEALSRKLENNQFDFRGVWFPDDVVFTNELSMADFSFATFSDFAGFDRTVFGHRISFCKTMFGGRAGFYATTFRDGADFSGAVFTSEADFSYAKLGGSVEFVGTSFQAEAVFFAAEFVDQVRFAGSERFPIFNDTSSLDLQFVRSEKPASLVFHTLIMRPCWFVSVDARTVEFINVEWRWRSAEAEIESLEREHISSPHRLLAITCRHLAVNAEENHRYEEASKFRYIAMDSKRLEHWYGFDFRRLSWWYWLASGFGERVLRASVVLVAILFVSAALYTQMGFARWEPRLTSESDVATGNEMK